MPQIRPTIFLCAFALLIAGVPTLLIPSSEAGTARLQAPTPEVPTPVVAVAPNQVHLSVGDTSDLEVGIENPASLYAFELKLAFDASVVQISDADPNLGGVQVQPGSLLTERQHFVAANRVDNEAGTINFAVSLLGPEAPIDAGGDLIAMTVSAESNGTSPVDLTQVMLADQTANIVPADVVDGTIIVGPEATATSTLTPTSEPQATATLTATATPTSTATPTTTSSPTATPTATSSPTVTPTPRPSGTTTHVQLPLLLHNHVVLSGTNP